ncbi:MULTISPECIES: HAD family hydrolase [Micrococcaceae]|uniref:Phosphoserine phosphatase n=1 Tax=Arthrobacter rhombi TaxID=71253 RepID=A0A1R4G593_9MICC|nr:MULTISPECIES: HAD-IB family hydrolase [Micrococcaceae]PCC26024.1 HAD-IB family hydrolase [Glutamicibacter sp. BW78]SJM63344.1 Phosphoserine phosphatase [Arthrobacter rhombi]
MPEQPRAAHVSADPPIRGHAAAFFDVDNTMMRGASLFAVARKMYSRGAFSLRHALWMGVQQVSFILRGEDLAQVHRIRDQALALAAGILVDDMSALGDEIYDEFIASRIWPGTRALAQAHLDGGRPVWLVTATPVEVAEVIAGKLGLSGALGTVVDQHEGVYTGRLVGEILHGPAKATAVTELAAREDLDLSESWAYSDSYNDVPLLTVVGHPVAINPDVRLRRHALAHNWPVYDFRRGRRAATIGIRAATLSGAAYGLWRGLQMMRRHFRP